MKIFEVRSQTSEVRRVPVLLFTACCLLFTVYCFAQEKPSSSELLNKAWAAHGQRDTDATFNYTNQLIELYQHQANEEQSALKELPKNKDEIQAVQVLNDVATAYFIQAESYMRQQNIDEAKKIFQLIIEKYPYGQAWDQRGWFWQISKTAKQSKDKLDSGLVEDNENSNIKQVLTKIVLFDPGKEDFVDYAKYGKFENVGTKDYKYLVKDQKGLSEAVGEGVYPNTASIRQDPEYKKAQKEKKLEGSHWDFTYSLDLQVAFLKWATAPEPPGVKLFYTASVLERSGLITQAIKCYYSIVVHFPGSYGWTYWHTPWYIGQASIAKINFLLEQNPDLGYKLVDADIKILNGNDNSVANDIFMTNPGRFIKTSALKKVKPKFKTKALSVKNRRGEGKVHLVQYKTGDWQLMVDNKPYIIKAVTYAPTKVGESPDEGTMTNWMENDFNSNGKIDGPYDAFVDKNNNNLQDGDEPNIGDFKLMQEMGVNTIRVYHQPLKVHKELLRDLYNRYGIRVIMGDFLGKYTFGSGAAWDPGTDYNNEQHKKNMMESVMKMVAEFKDEPFVLCWLLGNENVYGYACNADKEPKAFFSFANEVAKAIKAVDKDHPVAVCNGDILFLDEFSKNSPDIDIFGTNAYRGNYGFSRLWKNVKEEADRAVMITEYGVPSCAAGYTDDEAEEYQAQYHKNAWSDIIANSCGQGAGNAIGGVAFEWLDEWWKGYEPSFHDRKGLWPGPFLDGKMHEEWLGLCGQGDGKNSPFLRQLKKSYYTYKELWSTN